MSQKDLDRKGEIRRYEVDKTKEQITKKELSVGPAKSFQTHIYVDSNISPYNIILDICS